MSESGMPFGQGMGGHVPGAPAAEPAQLNSEDPDEK